MVAQTQEDGSTSLPEPLRPLILPLGDRNLLVRFGRRLTDSANKSAILAAKILSGANLGGVQEITPSLISVCLRYDPVQTGFVQLSNAVSLTLSSAGRAPEMSAGTMKINVRYGGEIGSDLEDAAAACTLSPQEFIAAHNSATLRVLATGFAPGFVYCGMHEKRLHIPRRKKIHARVPPGSVIFAAGQTAITATHVPTGWHVIGRTDFRNFNPANEPPTKLAVGGIIRFSSDMRE
ncbi:MAG TPA: carboxyltransferase domain-containing protein [Devosia sp.]|nr:carboxyltransferase domain-containing protein [Devosia sp.]